MYVHLHSSLCMLLCLLRYDPKTDTWTIVAPINSPRDAVGVCMLGDKLYAVGGYDGSMYRHDVEAYDPQANEWSKVCNLCIAESYEHVFIIAHQLSVLLTCITPLRVLKPRSII